MRPGHPKVSQTESATRRSSRKKRATSTPGVAQNARRGDEVSKKAFNDHMIWVRKESFPRTDRWTSASETFALERSTSPAVRKRFGCFGDS